MSQNRLVSLVPDYLRNKAMISTINVSSNSNSVNVIGHPLPSGEVNRLPFLVTLCVIFYHTFVLKKASFYACPRRFFAKITADNNAITLPYRKGA